ADREPDPHKLTILAPYTFLAVARLIGCGNQIACDAIGMEDVKQTSAGQLVCVPAQDRFQVAVHANPLALDTDLGDAERCVVECRSEGSFALHERGFRRLERLECSGSFPDLSFETVMGALDLGRHHVEGATQPANLVASLRSRRAAPVVAAGD